MDSEGNTSEPSVQIISKDTQSPTNVALTVTSYDKTSITVNATGTDDASGIISYAFQISQTENDDDFTTVETVPSTENSCAYRYSNLSVGERYYLRVIVTDVAGYSTVSEIVKRSTQDNGIPDEEFLEEIGKYVDYEPVSGNFSSDKTYSGYNSTKDFSTNTEAQWQILFVNDDIVRLIAENPTNTAFSLSGANGYNNGVKLLNDASKAMYSNSSLGAVARSIKIEDIESISSYDKTTYTNYGKEYSPSSYKYYPNIFKDELTGSVDGRYGSLLGLSDQTEYITGSTEATILGGKMTYYSYTMSTTYMSSTYLNIFKKSTTYWFATRCVQYNRADDSFHFGIFHAKNGTIGSDGWYGSDDGGWGTNYALRPVVEIDRSAVTIGRLGDGSRNSQYSIEPK